MSEILILGSSFYFMQNNAHHAIIPVSILKAQDVSAMY